MYYTWNTEVSKLVRSGASTLSGLIGSEDPLKSNFDLLSGCPDDYYNSLDIYKKKNHDVFLVVRKTLGLRIYCKTDSMHGLMEYLKFSKSLQVASDYIDFLNEDDSEDADDADDAEAENA